MKELRPRCVTTQSDSVDHAGDVGSERNYWIIKCWTFAMNSVGSNDIINNNNNERILTLSA